MLTAVFVPCAFITGITGQFFRQFALTIAISTVISAFNSLTLSPALSALLLQPRQKGVFQALPWPAFVAVGGWAGYALLGPQLLELADGARLAPAHWPMLSPELAAKLVGLAVGGLRRLAGQRPAEPHLRLDLLPLQPGVRRGHERLHPDGRRPAAGQRAGARCSTAGCWA